MLFKACFIMLVRHNSILYAAKRHKLWIMSHGSRGSENMTHCLLSVQPIAATNCRNNSLRQFPNKISQYIHRVKFCRSESCVYMHVTSICGLNITSIRTLAKYYDHVQLQSVIQKCVVFLS